jgi:CRP-like cAMP-binding protein
LALVGGIFLVSTFVVRTIVPMRILCIVSIVFFLGSAALAGSVPKFFLYLLALPVNVIRLVQIRNLVKKARSSQQGTLSLDWLRPFMTPRNYQKGDVLFRKGDAATEMFLTVTGKFLVTEIGIEIPAGRILGELGFLSPKNFRTQSIECIENGEVLTIAYDKLLEIYMQNPEFGYFFLRLTSDRLLQNLARFEGLIEQDKIALAAAIAAKSKQPPGANVSASAPAGENVVEMAPKQMAGAAAATSGSISPASADIEAARRRMRALAIVERHANYSAAGGFIPLPIANEAAIMAVIVRMVRALSRLYDKPVEQDRAYSIVVGLMGGVMPARLATVAASTAVYLVPGYNLVGLAVTSVTASAYARRIGRKLVERFEREAELEREALERDRFASMHARWKNVWPIRLARIYRTRVRSSLDHGLGQWWRMRNSLSG